MDILESTHAGMAPRIVPNAFPRIIGDHDWVNVFGRSEILAGPVHVAELLLGRVIGVDICALPASHEFSGRNGLKLVKNREVLFSVMFLRATSCTYSSSGELWVKC